MSRQKIRANVHDLHEVRAALQQIDKYAAEHEDSTANPHTTTVDQAITAGVGQGGGGVAGGGGRGQLMVTDASEEWDALLSTGEGTLLTVDSSESLGLKWTARGEFHIPLLAVNVPVSF